MADVLFKTLAFASHAEITVKKSQFICNIEHVETQAEANAFVSSIKNQHRFARHNVYAFILQTNNYIKCSDDGEPQKTAGMPTLNVLQRAGLSDVVAVTTRYFGGTLLGTGGLLRAYTDVANAAIDVATIVNYVACRKLLITCDYSFYDSIVHASQSFDCKLSKSDFSAAVNMEFLVSEEQSFLLRDKLMQLTSGRCECAVSDTIVMPKSWTNTQ